MKALRILPPALLLAALAACGFRPAKPRAEADRAPTTFPHEIHGGFECSDCHTGIIKSTVLGDSKLPGVAKCEECHDRSTPADKAKFTPPKREARQYQLRFDHAAHLKRVPKGDCAACHRSLPDRGQPWKTAPPMATCLECHAHKADFAAARCTPCHVSLKQFPLRPVTEYSHEGNFVREHGRLAKDSAETCAACHDQTYCARCHATATAPMRVEIRFPEEVRADFIHRADFVSRHQIEAAADPASCRKCHGSRFCETCHLEQGISQRSLNPRDPHPPGWATPGSGEFHGTAARINIVSCAGCHDQGASSICVLCHRKGGPAEQAGAKIHPPGYKPTDKSKPMCRACH